MKNLNLISFVGVDEQTNLADILKMGSVVPCEFSVLFSDSKSIGNYTRYPSYKFCKDFLEWGTAKDVYTSLHLCGSVIERYLKQEQDVMDLCTLPYRIQLNLNISNFPDYEKLSNELIEVATKHNHKLILQQNKTKEKFMSQFEKKLIATSSSLHISLLHDSSGGFGREITQVDVPTKKYFTGYAGGIKPENVSRIVKLIESNNPENTQYYIDMESGVRENNIFSIEKCRQVIDNLV